MTNQAFRRKQAFWPTKADDPIPLTAETYASLQEEQKTLLEEQTVVMERLKVAREMGDLSENGAYKYAKFELGNIRRRLNEVNRLLKLGVIIQKQHTGTITFGSEVTIRSAQGERTFLLVSEHEANPAQGKLSDKSPIGSAVTGKQVGETVTVMLPTGETVFEIVRVASKTSSRV